jgi:hypothetical protein
MRRTTGVLSFQLKASSGRCIRVGSHWFARYIVESGRLPLFVFFVSLIAGFIGIRISVRMIRAKVRWWPGFNITSGGMHIHHVVLGTTLMLGGGVAAIVANGPKGGATWVDAIAAGVFGLGSALVLDEFALILHLRDVYWSAEGRLSVEAVFVAIAVTGLLLLGLRPATLGDDLLVDHLAPSPAADHALAVGYVLVNLVLSTITLLKGKIWTGLAGLFLPLLLLIGAIRLAVPNSPWARWRYPAGSRILARAMRRDARLHRPIRGIRVWFQDLVAGRPEQPAITRRPEQPATALPATTGRLGQRVAQTLPGQLAARRDPAAAPQPRPRPETAAWRA